MVKKHNEPMDLVGPTFIYGKQPVLSDIITTDSVVLPRHKLQKPFSFFKSLLSLYVSTGTTSEQRNMKERKSSQRVFKMGMRKMQWKEEV